MSCVLIAPPKNDSFRLLKFRYMMGSSMLLAASRQSYAFSRDSGPLLCLSRRSLFCNSLSLVALPFSFWLYRMNSYTGTPVNTVVFVAGLALLLGLLAFAGTVAIDAVFAISVTALYIAYAIPISARWLGDNQFKPGPFNLGFMASTCNEIFSLISDHCLSQTESSCFHNRSPLHVFPWHCLSIPHHATNRCFGHELHCRRPWRRAHSLLGMVLFPKIWWCALVHRSCRQHR